MEKELKDRIVEAVNAFMAQNNLKSAEFARKAGVNGSYFNHVYRGIYVYQNTPINDSFFRKIAKACNYSLEQTYWHHVDTDQYDEIMLKLDEAHRCKYINTIIGKTGCGKSYAVDSYVKRNPLNTVLVTVNSNDDVYSIMGAIAKKLDITLPTSRGCRLRALTDEIERQFQQGTNYLLIIDEGENTKAAGIKAYKALYDLVVKPGFCGMALVGTPDMIKNIERFERYGQSGMSQFMRRIRAGITYLADVNIVEEFAKFMDAANITDNGLRKHLMRLCDNYGVLHDYLERAIRITEELDLPLTERVFIEIYNIKHINDDKTINSKAARQPQD